MLTIVNDPLLGGFRELILLGFLLFLHACAMVNICGIFGIPKCKYHLLGKRDISSQDMAFKHYFIQIRLWLPEQFYACHMLFKLLLKLM